MKKILNALLILILLTSVAYGAASDYKVKADGTIYGYDLIVKGPWVDARAYTTLELANTAAYNAGKLLVIAQNYTLTANTTLTAAVQVIKGGSFTKAGTYTLAINGTFSNPNNGQCFIGFSAGDVTGLKVVKAEWFGTTSALINVGLAAVAGGMFEFSATTYNLDSNLLPLSNTTIKGQGRGATILSPTVAFTHDNVIRVLSKTNVIIKDLKIDASLVAVISGVGIQSSSDCEVRNVHIHDINHASINVFEDSYRNLIEGNLITAHTGGAAIFLFHGASYNRVLGNMIYNNTSYGILIDGGTTGSANEPSNYNVVEGNVIDSATAGWGIGVEGSSFNIVKGNSMNLPTASYALTCDVDNTLVAISPKNNIFEGNIISCTSYGMRLNGESNTVRGNRIVGADIGIAIENPGAISNTILYNVVSGNLIGPGKIGGTVATGIQTSTGPILGLKITDNIIFTMEGHGIINSGADEVEISGNYIRSCNKNGIYLFSGNSKDNWIHNNKIVNASVGSVGTYNGILVATGTTLTFTRLRVVDNIFVDNQDTPTMTTGLYLSGSGTLTQCQFDRNRIFPSTLTDLWISNPSTALGDSFIKLQTISAGAVTLYPVTGELFQVNLTGNITMNSPAIAQDGKRISIVFKQDATGGRTVLWNAAWKVTWADTGNTANKRSTINFICNGSDWIQDGAQSPYN